ncbi:Spore maturation protein A [Pseudobythopirellula maris]|uniref:Spore maturation protein A n=1 Tax=Pseudobythopirellula maris TaxID=2527991 RepID=A0A5C5ZLC0_9BACT|nr:nucleoside recognition domain-containing protein [Pseudobythopirellula maris]TWT87233.1 Spore maturation protein A [Pseudobythopirellula maris]
MLNRIWFWLLVIGVGYGLAKGTAQSVFGPASEWGWVQAAGLDDPPAGDPPLDAEALAAQQLPVNDSPLAPLQDAGKELTEAALEGATVSVEICLGLIGVMALWLGMLAVARDAGMVDGLAWLLRPVMRWLFPDVPDGHPAQGSILMNMSANMLGLDNAATPFGLQAMRDLQTLNPHKETATNAMATFLAINTSSVTLIPSTIIALRVTQGSENPASPLFGMLLATIASTIVAIFTVRFLSRLPQFAAPPADEPAGDDSAEGDASQAASNEGEDA